MSAAKVFKIFGNKHKKAEPEEHRFEFPGGYIGVCRTTDGEYWAHLGIWDPNKQQDDDMHLAGANAVIVDARLDYPYQNAGTIITPELEGLNHIAIRIALEDK